MDLVAIVVVILPRRADNSAIPLLICDTADTSDTVGIVVSTDVVIVVSSDLT